MIATETDSGRLPPQDHIELLIAHLIAHGEPQTVPQSARDAARMFLFDSLGVALSGAALSESALVLNVARNWGIGEDAHVWGSHERLPAPSAALINAYHIHNQEFDCVHERAVVHPMAVILAALFAYAERRKNVSGTQFLTALALAVDVAAVVGMSATRPIRFFRPAQCGCLGATAGMAVLAGFDANAMRNAFGIAYSQLAGTMQAHIEGSPTLALQVGFAARAAVTAVDLAAAGFRGPHQVLDGKYGYFALFETEAAPQLAFAELGKRWQIEQVSHKPFPTGRAAQGGIAGIRLLMQAHEFVADDVDEVVLEAPPLIRQLVDRPMLADMPISYARLCLPFLVATTLKHGSVSLDAYDASRLRCPQLFALAARVKLVADANSDPNALSPQRLLVRLNDGRCFEHAMSTVFGAPQAPMSAADQRAKFDDCCRHAVMPLDEAHINALVGAIHDIEKMGDISELLSFTYPNS